MSKVLRWFLFAALVLTFSAGPALAQVREGSVTLTPQIGYYFMNDYQNLDDSWLPGVALGYQVTRTCGLELFLGAVDSNQNRFGSQRGADLIHSRLDGLYHFLSDDPEQQRLVPYLAAGIGANFIDYAFAGGTDTDLLLDGGGGVKYFLAENWALRADGRAIFADGTLHAAATGGVSFLFGGERPAPARTAMKAPEPAPKPAPVVEKKPAPAPPPVPVPVVPVPVDSDGDGVVDGDDQCPGTPPGVPVDAVGCPLSLTLNINFEFDKAVIKPEFTPILDKAAAFINRHEDVQAVIVAGHTDSKGSVPYNQRLSERRAQAVAEALVEYYGIDRDRLVVRGYGETRPVADNSTEEGRYKNRRVEIICCDEAPES